MPRPNETTQETASSDAPKPMFTDSQMRKLKAAVIGMGFILLAGFALVIGRIVYLLNRPSVDSAVDGRTAATATSSASGATTLVPDAQLALPEGAVIRHLSLAGSRMAVHFEAPSGAGIHVFDMALGRTVQRISVQAGKGLR